MKFSSPLPVSDIGANTPELIQSTADLLSKSAQRKAVFAEIYNGKKKVKTVDELMVKTGLIRNRVLDAGKFLVSHHIVNQIKINGKTAYEKIGFYQNNKSRILRLAENPIALSKFPTKRNTNTRNDLVNIKIKYLTNNTRAQANFITIDDIESFSLVKSVPRDKSFVKMPEKQFKIGVARILGELGEFTDWGGEVSDLYSSNTIISNTRKRIAFAFKGPGTSGPLTPRKLGHNGDQIQRLVSSPADVFIIQYWAVITEAVIMQLEQLVQLRSIYAEKPMWYGIIDGHDSARLIKAYPAEFELDDEKKTSV